VDQVKSVRMGYALRQYYYDLRSSVLAPSRRQLFVDFDASVDYGRAIILPKRRSGLYLIIRGQ